MESLMTFIVVILIVFGILQIILFFKIWGMTNDVRRMKDGFFGSDLEWQQRKMILKNDKMKISEILFDDMFNKIKFNYEISRQHGNPNQYFIDSMSKLKKEFKEKYLKYGIDFPESVDKIEKREDIKNL